MATGSLTVQPHLYIGDSTGRPLDYGRIYFGEPNKDPEDHPINIFYDPELTVAASQPVRTKGGFMNAFGDMVEVYAIEQSYSVKVLDESGVTVFYKSELNRTLDINTTIRANNLLIAPSTGDKVGQQVFEYRDAVDLIWTIVPAGIYLKDSVIANASITGDKIVKESITGDKIAKNAALNTPLLPNTYALTTLDAPNLTMDATGALTRSNDPLNASTRKVGTAAGNLVERGADGYPTNNNALGVGQTWQDMTVSRSNNVTYTNDTGRPIFVRVCYETTIGTDRILEILTTVNSVQLFREREYSATVNTAIIAAFIVPTGMTYKVESISSLTSLISWSELR